MKIEIDRRSQAIIELLSELVGRSQEEIVSTAIGMYGSGLADFMNSADSEKLKQLMWGSADGKS